MSRSVSILMVVVLLTGGGVVALVIHERNLMEGQLAEARARTEKLEAEVKSLRAERDQLQKKLQQQPLADADTTEKPKAGGISQPGQAGKPAPADGKKAKPANPLAQMMKDPKMREMMKQQQIAAMDMQYAGLMSKFNFNDGEKADFKQLLADRLQKEADLGFKMMEDMTPEGRAAALQEYNDAKTASDARIRDFLNSDSDYNTFKQWEDTKGERMQLDMGRALFTSSGEPLTADQEQQLITTMHSVNSQPGSAPDLSKPQNFDPAKLTPADIEKQMASYDEKAQAVAAQAAQFLTPKQVESLQTMQQQWRTMAQSGLQMAATMFGTQTTPTAK